MIRAPWMAVASLVILASLSAPARAGLLSTYATCDGSDNITVQWSFYEDPQNPVGHPEWVGYDVLRRSLDPCEPWTRVTATPYLRTPGISESFTYVEAAPAAQTAYEYQVILVDAGRNPLLFPITECDCWNGSFAWVSCPLFSAPLTQGTLTDGGWALYVNPCPGSCYSACYLEGPLAPSLEQELRSYLGTGTVLRFYGTLACGGVEGCGLRLNHFDVAPCGSVVPATRSTWGQIKVLYR